MIKTIPDMHHVVDNHQWGRSRLLFRGVSSKEYGLRPKLGRLFDAIEVTRRIDDSLKLEIGLLNAFKKNGHGLSEAVENDWHWLTIAQHHGLPTRFLDWTTNPLVALFFAVESLSEDNGAVYLLHDVEYIEEADSTPFELKDVVAINPPRLTKRIVSQSGRFTVHPEVREDWHPPGCFKMEVDAGSKMDLKRQLYTYGIDRYSLFPDLDNLSRHLSAIVEGAYGHELLYFMDPQNMARQLEVPVNAQGKNQAPADDSD